MRRGWPQGQGGKVGQAGTPRHFMPPACGGSEPSRVATAAGRRPPSPAPQSPRPHAPPAVARQRPHYHHHHHHHHCSGGGTTRCLSRDEQGKRGAPRAGGHATAPPPPPRHRQGPHGGAGAPPPAPVFRSSGRCVPPRVLRPRRDRRGERVAADEAVVRGIRGGGWGRGARRVAGQAAAAGPPSQPSYRAMTLW